MYRVVHNMLVTALTIMDLLRALGSQYGVFCAVTHGHMADMIPLSKKIKHQLK
jgi:hypothetical protein